LLLVASNELLLRLIRGSGDGVVEGGVDVFHQRDTLLREVRDELLKRVIV
jgi:hypothetical protein